MQEAYSEERTPLSFVKKIEKKTSEGIKTYYYEARNYREKGKIKQIIIRALSPKEALEFKSRKKKELITKSEDQELLSELEQLRVENTILQHELKSHKIADSSKGLDQKVKMRVVRLKEKE